MNREEIIQRPEQYFSKQKDQFRYHETDTEVLCVVSSIILVRNMEYK